MPRHVQGDLRAVAAAERYALVKPDLEYLLSLFRSYEALLASRKDRRGAEGGFRV
jgi:hypothetical protein